MGPRLTPTTALCTRCFLNASRHATRSRYFSLTSRQGGKASIPAFEPTSSPKLDELLAIFRKTIFIPARLPKKQRAMVYKTSRHQDLKQNPITLQNGDEDIRVEPVAPTARPSIDAGVNDMIRLASEDPNDFRVLPKVLEGIKQARHKHSVKVMSRIARRANEMALQEVIIHCARAVKRTGFSLGHPAVANEVILGAHLTAQQSDWAKESLDLAIKNASDIARMLDEPEHTLENCDYRMKGRLNWETARGRGKINAQPYFIGNQLELLAMKAVKYQGGKDLEAHVQNFADKLLATWPNYSYGWSHVTSTTSSDTATGLDSPGSILLKWLPTWNGIKAALKVEDLKPSQVKALKEHLTFLDKTLTVAHEALVAMEQDLVAQGKEIPLDWQRTHKMYDELSNLKI